jgi:hypothetical protein
MAMLVVVVVPEVLEDAGALEEIVRHVVVLVRMGLGIMGVLMVGAMARLGHVILVSPIIGSLQAYRQAGYDSSGRLVARGRAAGPLTDRTKRRTIQPAGASPMW